MGSSPGDFFLKLPVNLQTTSYLRTVSPNAVHNGVALARICKTLMGRHAVLSEKTGFLLETEGAFSSKKSSQDMTMDDIMLSKHLGYIVRQSPYDIIGPDEVPIVTAALTDPNRFTDQLPLHDLIDKFAASLPENDKGHAPEMWFRAFLEVSVEGLLTLLSGYGIGFEAHGQNTLTVVARDSGRPVRLLLRDFGGIRVSLDRLRTRGLKPEFFQKSVTVKDTMDEVTN